MSLLRQLPPRPGPDNAEEDGWMDEHLLKSRFSHMRNLPAVLVKIKSETETVGW